MKLRMQLSTKLKLEITCRFTKINQMKTPNRNTTLVDLEVHPKIKMKIMNQKNEKISKSLQQVMENK
jgi:hypothetical protein